MNHRQVLLFLALGATGVAAQRPVPAPRRPTVVIQRDGPPVLSYGTPELVTAASRLTMLNASIVARGTRYEVRQMRGTVGGRLLTKRVLHLSGLEGIEAAPNDLPDGVRRLLEIHARKTPAGQQTYYIVDPEVTNDWIKTHPVDADIKPRTGKKCKGSEWERFRCRSQKSWDDVEDMTNDEWERLRKNAQEWWDDAAKKLKECTTTTNGWTDHRMTGPTVPIRFNNTPHFPLSWTGNSAAGNRRSDVTVKVDVGIPLQGDMQVATELFYIPCLPGVYRFRSVAAAGSLTIGQRLAVNVSAAAEFEKSLPVGPANGIQIPLYVIPVVINGVPVAEFDVSAHVEGDVDINARATGEASLVLTNSNRVSFAVSCDGKGCQPDRNKPPNVTGSTSASESAQVSGELTVTPKLYTALELNFNISVLTARTGPETRLVGRALGCAGTAATQASGGGSTSLQGTALAADLDWGMKLKSEALVLDQLVADPNFLDIKPQEHLWFKDLIPGGSTALVAAVAGPTAVSAGQAAEYSVRLPCYYSPGPVRYEVKWTGTAAPALMSAIVRTAGQQCSWKTDSGICAADPKGEFRFSLRWSTPGPQTVSVTLIGDNHVQRFSPAPAAGKLDVAVGSGGSGPP